MIILRCLEAHRVRVSKKLGHLGDQVLEELSGFFEVRSRV